MAGQLVAKDGSKVSKGRIRPALITAVRLMIEEGLNQTDAAQRVGMNPVSLGLALKKPHVKALWAAVKRAWLENETSKAWLTMADLANRAGSEDVRHKSAKVFLDAAGELDGSAAGDGKGPRTLVQIVMHHAPEAAQPIPHRLPGVIEAKVIQRERPDPSNFTPVGRDE